ncbi:tRNA 2-selenouridine(34) synthase MnmH [Roseibacillus ishigakijimensis]|uniref:tRNA 2-selenouridine(34) synthase MnmH n=1 Tax=Roseibacillus ishigakijimensis TaxID=454146 RepID=A0A934RRF1_9BACT|nr:tRNA 2-selenouridine(34) synthase MnmH [Roseibacillus ishigakijimensis]
MAWSFSRSLMQDIETVTPHHPLEEFSSIVDVRTPPEFAEDHLPGAINLPVLTTAQRVEVGTLYKQDPFAARIMGARYISLNAADHLLTLEGQWDRHAQPLLYCWRGGLRSHSLAHILRSVGWRARLLEGGYKAYRKFVLADSDERLTRGGLHFHVLAGLTGTGKTRLLHHLSRAGAQVLDLEQLANHRGSLLGNLGPQPSQKLFENRLHQALATMRAHSPIFVEAESNRIGQCHLPAPLWQRLAEAPVTEVRLPLPHRARLLLQDYPRFLDNPQELMNLLDKLRPLRGNEQVNRWHEHILAKDWPAFLESVLRDHYDPAYRAAGEKDSNYRKPDAVLALADDSPTTFAKATRQLLAP